MITIDELHDLIVREYERAGFGAAAEAVHALIATRLRHARCNANGLGNPDGDPLEPPDADGYVGKNGPR